MIRLVAALRLHGEAIEADFQEVYHLELGQLAASGKWARINRLVQQLPEESRYVVAASREYTTSGGIPDISNWRRSHQLMATIIDELTIANWQRSGQKKKPRLMTEARKRVHNPRPLGLDQEKVRAYLKLVGPQTKEPT